MKRSSSSVLTRAICLCAVALSPIAFAGEAPLEKRTMAVVLCPLAGEADASAEARKLWQGLDQLISALATDTNSSPIVLARSGAGPHCATLNQIGTAPPGPAGPEVVIGVRGVQSTGPGDPPALQIRISYRIAAPDLQVKIDGRTFAGSFVDKQIILPHSLPGNERALVAGLIRTLLYREEITGTEGLPEDARSPREKNRYAALAAWGDLAQEPLAERAPIAAALAKQMQALLLLDGPCAEQSPAELLRAAARLVPYDANARALAALVRLQEAYQPRACARAAEAELYESLALNPWSDESSANLGVLYELSLNAHSGDAGDRDVPAAVARDKLATVWKHDAPLPPFAFELGVAGGFYAGFSDVSRDEWLRALAPGARVELAYGRDGTGLGVRLAASFPWTREIPIEEEGVATGRRAQASWSRFAFGIGPRYRLGFGSFYGEVAASLLVAPLIAQGQDFDDNRIGRGIDLGVDLGLRIGKRLGPFALWGTFVTSYYRNPGDTQDRITAVNGASVALPTFDAAAMFGASLFFWR